MLTRREYLKWSSAGAVSLALASPWHKAFSTPDQALISRGIPGTDERLPAVGLGSSASFSRMAGAGDVAGILAVLEAFVQHGGRVFDTAPSYGEAERMAAEVVRTNGLKERLFWATKVNVAGRGGGRADAEEARAQIEESFTRLGKRAIDLVQVHNLGDVPTQLGLLKEYRQSGRIRFIGVTTTFSGQYALLEKIMRREPLDFIGVDYAIDHRVMEERIFPLAQDRGIGVLAYQPFGRTRLWQKVEGQKLPEWAAEYDISSWGQFFLKFVIAHPAVTTVTPATSRVKHVIDNLSAARGRLPDQEGRRRMVEHIASLA